MTPLCRVVEAGRKLCAIGFDDAPFEREAGSKVHVGGIVCNGTRFEGMLWGETTKDGTDATEVLMALLSGSKFLPQLHVVLTDGVTVGGLNVVDLQALHDAAGLPCIAVMRRPPDLARMRHVVERLPGAEARWAAIERAGPIHTLGGFTFQVLGTDPADAVSALAHLTDRGKVPEPLRLAHMIGAAIMHGESSRRA